MRAREMTMFSHSLHFIIYILSRPENIAAKKNQRNEIVKDNANILLTTTAEATKTKTAEQEQKQRQKPQRTKVGNAYCVAALP